MKADTSGGALPKRALAVNNRQRACRVDAVRLRRLVRSHLENQLELSHYSLAIHLVSPARMAEVNEAHLGHTGATDVITFDYADPARKDLHGELLVCPAVAVEQAREYGTTWEAEILRYIIHGLLHLRGYDDGTAAGRRAMKAREDHFLRGLMAGHSAGRVRGPRTSPKHSLE